MRMSRRVRIASAATGVIVLVGAASGITYAATAGSKPAPSIYATACTTSTHGLRLISHGKCPTGDAPIKLAAAPTPLAISATRATKTVTVGGWTFAATCSNDMGGEHAELDINSTHGYDVQGSYVFDSYNSGSFNTPGGSIAHDGAGQITYTAPSNDPSSEFQMTNNAGATGTFEVIRGGHTATITFAMFAINVYCSVQAQIAPSS